MVKYSYILVDPLSSFGSEEDIRRALALLRDCGYEGVEINLTDPLGVDPERLRGWLAELGFVVPAFLTGSAYFEGLCLSSPDQAIRGEAVQRLVRYVEIGQEFNAILVIGLMQGLLSDEPDVDVANRRIVDCLRSVADVAEDRRVKMVIEPVNHLQVGFNNSVSEVLRLIECVNSPSIRPMVDTIHLNIEEKSLIQPILDCGSDLGHVHLCESNGSLFGSGNIDFQSVLKALRDIDYDGFASVKVYRKASLEVGAPFQYGIPTKPADRVTGSSSGAHRLKPAVLTSQRRPIVPGLQPTGLFGIGCYQKPQRVGDTALRYYPQLIPAPGSRSTLMLSAVPHHTLVGPPE